MSTTQLGRVMDALICVDQSKRNSVFFGLHGINIRLVTDSEKTKAFCKACLYPFLEHFRSAEELWKVYALKNSDVFRRNSTEREVRKGPEYRVFAYTDGDRGLVERVEFYKWPVQILHVPKERIAIVIGEEKNVSVTTMKLLRQMVFFRLEMQLAYFSLLHAAAICMGNEAVVFLSPGAEAHQQVTRGAKGKSLAQMSCLLSQKRTSFLTDDLLPIWLEGGDAYVCGYPDYLDLKVDPMSNLFPEVQFRSELLRKDFGERHAYLTPDVAEKEYGIVTSSKTRLPIRSLFLTDLCENATERLQLLPINDVSGVIESSLRLDHLFDEVYNPNWLGLPRKFVEKFKQDTAKVAQALMREQPITGILRGRISMPEEVAQLVLRLPK